MAKPPDGCFSFLGGSRRRIRTNVFLRFGKDNKDGCERDVFPATGSLFIYQFPLGMVELAQMQALR